jgi:hypothetical protein
VAVASILPNDCLSFDIYDLGYADAIGCAAGDRGGYRTR